MSPQPVSVKGRADAAELRNELLGRLGLRASASDADVETAHNGLVEFLELAPHEVKTWAAARTTDVDEAFALLTGPEADLVPAALTTPMAQAAPVKTPPPPVYVAPAGVNGAPSRKPGRTQLIGAAVILLIAGVVFAVYYMGKSNIPGIEGTPTGQETTAAAAANGVTPVDQAKLGALMQKISANPKDIPSLQSIADLYFGAKDYKNATLWEQKILAVDPKNQVALLALGAAEFNQGNAVEAKKQWLIAAGLYPKNAEVHYDLGFLYMSATPPDNANRDAEWRKVVAIDPNSDLAKTVATHIKAPTAAPTTK